jgi:hypothetical protein
MSSSIFKINATGTALMAFSGTVPAGLSYRLVSVTCNFNAAPVTSENFTITLDANAGAAYDLLLYTLDPSAGATSDILWQPDEEIILEGGDQIDVAFDNSDSRLYGAQITFKAV